MSLTALGWLFVSGVLLHNVEEALFFPQWSMHAARWHPRVRSAEVRIAAGILSAGLVVLAFAAARASDGSFVAYAMAGFALTMALNAFLPHLIATAVMRRYMPGTATALLLNLPLGLLYLNQALTQHRIESRTFVWAGPLSTLALLALLPALFALGRTLSRPH